MQRPKKKRVKPSCRKTSEAFHGQFKRYGMQVLGTSIQIHVKFLYLPIHLPSKVEDTL
jgi:hypothetical protein